MKNSANNTVLGVVGASDRDGDTDTITYSLLDDADGTFTINSDTGAVSLAGTLDHETADSYTITVEVTDGNDARSQQEVTIQVNDINEAPTAADNTLTIDEDTTHTFTAANFGFSDVDDGDSLQSITITRLPTAGSLTLNGEAVTANQDISESDISNLVFTPAANAHGDGYADLQFTVSDGEASSEVQTITFDVESVNDAPTASDNTLTIDEDTSHTFTAENFGFSDVDEGDSLQSVTITALPAAGSLTLNGEAVTANQTISESDIGNLVFTPATNANGDGYANLTFTVSDGTDSSEAQTLTFNVSPVADAATITGEDSGAVTEDDAATLSTSGTLNVSDPDADEASFTAETVTGTYGSLTIDAEGNWSYEADNSQTEIQELGDGDTLTDTLTVQTADGTTQEDRHHDQRNQ